MPFRKAPGLFDSSSDSTAPTGSFLTAHIDGGARGNPGPAGFGVAIDDASGKRLAELSEFLGPQTNNFAEYSGLIAALEYAVEHGYRSLKVVSDSELLVKQIKGQYKVRSESLLDIYRNARELINKLDHFEVRHVLRHLNKDADRLANEAMDRGMKGIRNDRANAYAKPPAAPQQWDNRGSAPSNSQSVNKPKPQEVRGFVTGGVVQFVGEHLPNGMYVTIKPETKE